MTLNKERIVNSVVEHVRFRPRRRSLQLFLFPELDCTFLSRKRAGEIVDTLFEKIKAALSRGEDVRISRFGRFEVKFRWAKRGRNPQTGEAIVLRSNRTVRFKASPELKKKINTPPPGSPGG